MFAICLVALMTCAAVAGTKKISATGKAGPLISFSKMSPSEDIKHYVSLVRRVDTDICSDALFGTLKVDTMVFSDYHVGGVGTQKGYRTFTHASGDKIFSTFGGTTTVVRGKNRMSYKFEGKWNYTGGTGRFKGIEGKGTYSGGAGKKGIMIEWEGRYELPKAAKTPKKKKK